ncbi:hypothetical protein TcG_07432 [Trypanosoma cruzi]|nr:hypothetical protein TcG_07432 [Trypanosoma cruzi]
MILSGISSGVSSPFNPSIWTPMIPGTVMQNSQKALDDSSPTCLGLTVSGGSETALSFSLHGATQPSSPLLSNCIATGSSLIASGEKNHTPMQGAGGGASGGICNTPSESSFVGLTAQATSGQTRLETIHLSPHDVVKCAEHQKERTAQNMMRVLNRSGDVVWVCRPDVVCKVRKGGRAFSHGSRRQQPPPNGLPENRTSNPSAIVTLQNSRVVFTTPHMNNCAATPSQAPGCCIGGCETFVATPLALAGPPSFTQLSFLQPAAHEDAMFWLPVSPPPPPPPPPPPVYSTASVAGSVGGPSAAAVVSHVTIPPNFAWVPTPVPH